MLILDETDSKRDFTDNDNSSVVTSDESSADSHGYIGIREFEYSFRGSLFICKNSRML